jgi:acyl-CoA thioesterase II
MAAGARPRRIVSTGGRRADKTVVVGDLREDTTVERVGDDDGSGDTRYTAKLSEDWEIWGPMGGYVAAVALRAAADASPFARPASFFCQYLGVASFDTVDVEVATLRSAKTALAQRVRLTQAGRAILEATVWSVGNVEGLTHDATAALDPALPGPDGLPDLTELLSEEERQQGPPFPFWHNLDAKPISFSREQPEVLEPVWQEWLRFTPTATFDDPWVDACRSLILIDVQSWPAASRAHAWGHGFIAPSLDLYVAFHDPQPASGWLLADGHGPVARDGLMGWTGRLWSQDRQLVASGMGQLLCRRLPAR